MKKIKFQLCLTILAVLLVAGCSKSNSGASVALPPDQIPKSVSKAFDQSSEGTKQLADKYISDCQNQDVATAFTSLQKLSHKGDLTPEQRKVVVRSMLTTMKQLNAAAKNGDKAAQDTLHQYLSTR